MLVVPPSKLRKQSRKTSMPPAPRNPSTDSLLSLKWYSYWQQKDLLFLTTYVEEGSRGNNVKAFLLHDEVRFLV